MTYSAKLLGSSEKADKLFNYVKTRFPLSVARLTLQVFATEDGHFFRSSGVKPLKIIHSQSIHAVSLNPGFYAFCYRINTKLFSQPDNTHPRYTGMSRNLHIKCPVWKLYPFLYSWQKSILGMKVLSTRCKNHPRKIPHLLYLISSVSTQSASQCKMAAVPSAPKQDGFYPPLPVSDTFEWIACQTAAPASHLPLAENCQVTHYLIPKVNSSLQHDSTRHVWQQAKRFCLADKARRWYYFSLRYVPAHQ